MISDVRLGNSIEGYELRDRARHDCLYISVLLDVLGV